MTITVRNVPDGVTEILSRAAKRLDQSLQTYLLALLEREARLAHDAEIAGMEPVGGGPLSMAEIVKAVRAARGEPQDGAVATWDELAEYHDTTALMESGHWETEPPQSDPMVTTSLRLPKSLLDRVHARAAEEDTQATAWIHTLIESALADSAARGMEARVRRLEAAVFQHSA